MDKEKADLGRRALVQAGWAVPAVLAVGLPRIAKAGYGYKGHGHEHKDGYKYKKRDGYDHEDGGYKYKRDGGYKDHGGYDAEP